ncbi:aminotransferase class I/II-fold pyridoxal phosphate-dependent enzyme [bacterium]|nr:aminotransferase class I/II-fold pyridoxal phosphate-dependent enzyme [bacterium]
MPEPYLERARKLLALLRDPETRGRGLEQARELAHRTRTGEEKELLVRPVEVEPAASIDVLTLPSIFAPEDWGRTFLRGLLSSRDRDAWRGRAVVEVGAGSGWVSIALARFTPVAKIFALDLNPQAAVATEINAWLAGKDADGRLVAEKVEPGVSDLLSVLEKRDVVVDLVCGNIPQVLSPEEAARAHALIGEGEPKAAPRVAGSPKTSVILLDQVISENAPASVLRMLGDYTPPRGTFEDVLSLGLIAKVLENAFPRLKPEGRIVLSLAGRPGFDVLRWVFARWGYSPRVLTKARIPQDPSTDITPFARAEEATDRRFSFFSSRESREPISARDACERRARDEPVFHDLYVVEGRPYRHLASDGARRFLGARRLPYTQDPGTELDGLREEASVYFTTHLRLRARADEVFVAPSRGELLKAIALASTEADDLIILDRALEAHAADFARAGREVRVVDPPLERPLHEVMAARKRDPKSAEKRARLVVASLGTREKPVSLDPEQFRSLVGASRDSGAVLVLDRTFAPIASLKRETDEVTQMLDGLWRSEGAIVTVDLAEHLRLSQPEPGFPLALALVGPHYGSMQRIGDATWSRAPTVVQAAHRHLLSVLNERYRGPRGGPKTDSGSWNDTSVIPRESRLAEEVARMPAFTELPEVRPGAKHRRIRLDFGESEFEVSDRLRSGLLEGLSTRDSKRLDVGAREAAASYFERSRGIAAGAALVKPDEIVLGAGAQALVSATIAAARSLGGGRPPLVILPRPFYGLFPAVIVAAGGELAPVSSAFDFYGRMRLDEDELRFRFDRAKGRQAVLLLANPNNPTGAYHERGSLERVLEIAAKREAIALVDEVFFCLRHGASRASLPGAKPEPGSARAPDPPASALEIARAKPELAHRLVVVDSLSKTFAAGGARVGFAWARDLALRAALTAAVAPPPPGGVGAARSQLADFEGDLAAHVGWLRERAQRTLAVLRELHLEAITPEGGLFVSVDFTPFERRTWVGTDIWGHEAHEPRPALSDFRRTLAEAAGLVVSPDFWSGWSLPHRRLVFSIEGIDTALVRLRAFATVLR